MKSLVGGSQLYIDVRPYDKSDALSYDLSQHLPRRLSVGPVVIVADNPPVLLSVIRKRLAKLLQEIERHRARTLDRHKRGGLNNEALRLRTSRFTAKSSAGVADVLCLAPYALGSRTYACATLYLTVPISREQLVAGLRMLSPGGLLVVYGEWPDDYEETVAAHLVL